MKHINIPVFIPHIGCPNDCVFCNQKHITGNLSEVSEEEIEKIIEEHLLTVPEDSYKEIAFFGGSFTGISEELQERYLKFAYRYIEEGKVQGIRLSTRPDYINKQILDRLKKYGVTSIELGVQSFDEEVLRLSNRGHTAEDVKNAVAEIRRYNFSLGLQMMTGLPGDTDEKSIETAKKIIAMKPDFVRIYPTLVIKDTELFNMYKRGEYVPQGLDEAVGLSAKLLRMFEEKKIKVIRVALMTTDEISPGGKLEAGPFHSSFRELCESRIYLEKILDEIGVKKCVTLRVNPKEVSKVIGNKKKNISEFEERGIKITIKQDGRIKKGNFKIN